jgi:hypothetical protein
MIEKLFIVITLIISLNFISGVLFKRYFKIDWNNNTLNLLQLLTSTCYMKCRLIYDKAQLEH